MASTACKLCACTNFTPNQWRRTLCQKCYHGYSAHGSGKVQQWYIAKIEGPYSWEQCRHWMDSGYFPASDKILVCSIAANPTLDAAHAERPGVHAPFQLLSDAFPDGTTAFVPAELADKYKRSSSAGSGGKVTPASGAASVDGGGSSEPSNMVDPMLAKMKAGWMKSFFMGGTAWYFIDDSGVTQGPFDADTMSAWFAAGYFWSKGLKIGHQGWSTFIPLQTILDGEGKPQSIAALAAAAPSAAAPASVAGASSAASVSGSVHHAPVPSASAAVSHAAPAAAPVSASVPSLSMPNPAAANEWMYVDESGNVQGPFTGEQMAEWTAWGYFHAESKIRNVGAMPDGVFLPLGVLFPDPGPDATDEELDATAPFESECWKEVWRKHNASNISVRR